MKLPKEDIKRKPLTPSPLDLGQPLQELQLTHNISLPVSICTVNSIGGVPNLTLVKYSLNKPLTRNKNLKILLSF